MTKTKPAEPIHWAESLADQVIERFPDVATYTGAAGISPSGPVHFGNFRDVSVTLSVLDALKGRGKQVRFVYSWDDFDRFRKVPDGVPASFSEHIGKPLSAVPDPDGKYPSYAKRYETEFEQDMTKLGLKLDYRYQTELYQAGTYDELILTALKKREQIAKILLSFMSDKAKGAKGIKDRDYVDGYFPVGVYSPDSGKDTTRVTGFDGMRTLTYEDTDTGQTDTVEIGKDRNVKLAWKVDWPMRWVHESVNFEPGGMDHAAPGSSFDAGDQIIKLVYDSKPPVHTGYGLVGIQGTTGKMSGSAGTGVSVGQLLEIYEPELLKWLYIRKQPKQYFALAFDSEIYRQYDEYDRIQGSGQPIPFRQAVAFGQIVQWDEGKLEGLLRATDMKYDKASVKSRLPRAKYWVEKYNPDEQIKLLTKPNAAYAKRLGQAERARINQLRDELKPGGGETVKALEELVYGIPKDAKAPDEKNRQQQRAFFKDVYNLLIRKDTGPRLGTFLWATDRRRVLDLLSMK
jgi:lysyl-tRNA synthetase, class I